MIDLGPETDGYNENCLGVRFALCIIKALRLARIEHCSGTVITPFLPSVIHIYYIFLCDMFSFFINLPHKIFLWFVDNVEKMMW